jgi:crotonobetainyl-CoA:carnitine CoA-transferase CaiB-like acyl-CoA transferase
MTLRKCRFNVTPLEHGKIGGKLDRIKMMQPYFKSGSVWFPDNAEWLTEMKNELAGVTRDELKSEYFRSHKLRVENPDIVYKSLSEIMALRTTEEWLTLGKSIGIPVAPVPNLGEIVENSDLHRGVISEAHHPLVGTYRHIESPFRFDGARPSLRHAAPRVGEQGSSVLRELGYSEEEMERLHRDGAVVSPIDD